MCLIYKNFLGPKNRVLARFLRHWTCFQIKLRRYAPVFAILTNFCNAGVLLPYRYVNPVHEKTFKRGGLKKTFKKGGPPSLASLARQIFDMSEFWHVRFLASFFWHVKLMTRQICGVKSMTRQKIGARNCEIQILLFYMQIWCQLSLNLPSPKTCF